MKAERARNEDIAELVDLRLLYLREDNGGLDEDVEKSIRLNLPNYYREHLNRDLFAYIVRNDQAILACALLLVVQKPMSPAFVNGKTGIVLNVYTRPPYRRKGYAGKLVDVMLGEAKNMELSVVELKATDDGYPLYLSAGFVDDESKYHPMKWVNRHPM